MPEDLTFKTKPEIARDLMVAALDAGVPCAFVLGDGLYGSDRRLRHTLGARQQPYVLAVRSNETMRLGGESLELTRISQCALTARFTSGGRIHPGSCR